MNLKKGINLKELARIISYIRLKQREHLVCMDFDLYHNSELIQNFYVEGCYNQIPKQDKIQYNETNYRLAFFYENDDHFEIWADTAIGCAELIEGELFGWLDLCNKIKITALHIESINKNFTIKVYDKRKKKKKKILLNACYKSNFGKKYL
tara:strand:- start:216 stop:668 length:453 start_codon:yes stop_codon:yes gene_type:complete